MIETRPTLCQSYILPQGYCHHHCKGIFTYIYLLTNGSWNAQFIHQWQLVIPCLSAKLLGGEKQTIPCTNYTDDIVLLANTPTQAESLLHSLDKVAGSIGFHVNAEKMEYICFNQSVDISTLNGGSLKLVGKFTYLGNSISSTKNDINKRLAKA